MLRSKFDARGRKHFTYDRPFQNTEFRTGKTPLSNRKSFYLKDMTVETSKITNEKLKVSEQFYKALIGVFFRADSH